MSIEHSRLRAQIRAGAELLNLQMQELSARLSMSSAKLSKAVTGETKSFDVLLDIKKGMERLGVVFTKSGGVELSQSRVEILEGADCYALLLDEIIITLSESDAKELLIMFASDKISPPEINNKYRRLRKSGVQFRQLIKKGDHYIMGPLNEYRAIPEEYFSNIVTVIYADKVAQVSGDEKRIAIHYDKPLAERERKIFSYFWDTGKKPKYSDSKEKF